jgi:uncharacterized protein YukE
MSHHDDDIPGDPDAVQAAADEWHRASAAISAAADQLHGVTPDGVWSGDSADSFTGKVESLVGQWRATAAALEDGAAQLSSFAAVLAWARREAEAAARMRASADERSSAARTQWEKDKKAAAAQPGLPSTRAVVVQPVFSDPGEADRAAAEQRLSDAKAAVVAAGNTSSSHLDGSMDWPKATVAADTLLKPKPGDAVAGPVGGSVTAAANYDIGDGVDPASTQLKGADWATGGGRGGAGGSSGMDVGLVAGVIGGTVVAGGAVVAGARLAGLTGLAGGGAGGTGTGMGAMGAVPPRTGPMAGGGEGASAGGRRGSRLQPTKATTYVIGLGEPEIEPDDTAKGRTA